MTKGCERRKRGFITIISVTKLVVSPPKHAIGKAPVLVKIDDLASNAVNYIYQIEPVVKGIYVGAHADSRSYILAVQNVAPTDANNKLYINGTEVEITGILRQGTPEYDHEPVGDKVVTDHSVPEAVDYVAIMDFEIESNTKKTRHTVISINLTFLT